MAARREERHETDRGRPGKRFDPTGLFRYDYRLPRAGKLRYVANGTWAGRLCGTVLLDLSKADYLDSNGVSWLIIAHKHFVQAGGRLILHSLPRRLQDTVDLLRLPSILDIVANETAARGLLQKVAP